MTHLDQCGKTQVTKSLVKSSITLLDTTQSTAHAAKSKTAMQFQAYLSIYTTVTQCMDSTEAKESLKSQTGVSHRYDMKLQVLDYDYSFISFESRRDETGRKTEVFRGWWVGVGGSTDLRVVQTCV